MRKKTKLLMTVLLTGFFMAGLFFFARVIVLPELGVPQVVEAPPSDADENNTDGEILNVPFYPTFENIWTLKDRQSLENYLYTVDETAYVYDDDLDIEAFLEMDFSAPLTGGKKSEPKILIFHTHSQESFIDSRPDEQDDTIVGVGSLLADILAEQYGVSVVHDVGQYDVADGAECRAGSYERMEPAIQALLDKYPTIEVTIDLHRDGVPDNVRLMAMVDGQPTARIMFFNGISRLRHKDEPIDVPSLPNPYIPQNLGLSLQMQLTANTLYPGLARRIYIKPYRYSLHFTPKSMLVEVGANTSTLAEARNAMKPLAEILMQVLCDTVN